MTTVEHEVAGAAGIEVVDFDVLMFLGPEVRPETPAPALLMSVPLALGST
jgi:hypothetical protein